MAKEQAKAGEAWSDIAAGAYRAYWASRGKTYPPFNRIRPEIRAAIEAAVRQAVAVFVSGSQKG